MILIFFKYSNLGISDTDELYRLFYSKRTAIVKHEFPTISTLQLINEKSSAILNGPIYQHRIIFNRSSIFGVTNNFTRSSKFGVTNNLTRSSIFGMTNNFTRSFKFGVTNNFTRSFIFGMTNNFTRSFKFGVTYNFTR